MLMLTYNVKNFAQNGSIIGTITDINTNESIVGANVIIMGTFTGASSDLDGKFELKNLPQGKYTLIVSFISYISDTIKNINVSSKETEVLNIRLKELSHTLTGVTIVERRRNDTEMSMISALKASNVTISGISRQQISRSQDKNASEVLRRVPGVTIIEDKFVVVRGLIERYNTVWLNNSVTPSVEIDQRAFSFDILASSMIDRILVYKTSSPELPADFAGAAIEVFTKNYPESNALNVGASVRFKEGTTYQDFYKYSGGKFDWLGFDDGSRAIPSGVPGISDYKYIQSRVTNGEITEDERNEARDLQTEWGRSFNSISTSNMIKASPDIKLNIDYSGKYTSKNKNYTFGNISSIHYENTNDYNRIFRATYEVYDTIQDKSVYIYDYNDDQYSNNIHLGALQNWSLSFGRNNIEFRNVFNQFGETRTTYRNGIDFYRNGNKINWNELAYESRTIYSGQLGGKHSLENDFSKIDWTIGYALAIRNQPDNKRIYRYSTYIDDSTYSPYQLDYTPSANTESNGRLFSKLNENIVTINAAYNTKIFIGNFVPDIKTGLYFESKQRDFNIRTFGLVRSGTSSQFDNSIVYQPIDSIYADTNFRFINTYDTINGVFPTAGIKLYDDTRPEYTYNAQNQLIAGYVGIDLPISKSFNIYTGVRIEKMRQQLEWLTEFGNDSTSEKYSNSVRDTINYFPSVNITYKINPSNLIRLAYGRTINRTEFRETAPYGFYDFEISATVYGNNELKNAYIDNFDFRYEWYPTPTEMVTIGSFYKQFKNPIEMNLFPASNGWDFVYSNAVKSYSLGVEIDVRKSLNSWANKVGILRYFKDFTIMLNAAIIKSEVTSNDNYLRDKQRPMFGQSPFMVNAGLYYMNEQSQFSFSILYNIIGKRIIVVGTPTIPNVYESPKNLLDITFAKKIGDHLEIKGGIKDLLDEPVKFSQTVKYNTINETVVSREQIIKEFKKGTSVMFGISYSF